MAKKDFIKRYMLILHLLCKKPASFEEIVNYLEYCRDSLEEKLEISQRTFQRDRKDILEIWGIDIVFNHAYNYYEIQEGEQVQEELLLRAMESFELVSAIKHKRKVGDSIFLEKRKANGSELFKIIIRAIEENWLLKFTHNSFTKKSKQRICAPKGIKESQGRFYLIAYDIDKKQIRNFGLERISNAEVIHEKAPSIDINIEKHYKYAFGIECADNPEKIVLQFSNSQLGYLESLPLHHSQHIIDRTEKYFKIELFMYETPDLVLEIMKYGSFCKVIEPQSLREKIINQVKELNTLYEV